MPARDIIAIGASAGGVEAIQRLVSGFPANLKAAVFVTLHVYGKSDGILPHLLNLYGNLAAAHAEDGERIVPGRIYIAPPDYHLMLRSGHVELSHGPRENMQRPCINAMFRSAAAEYRERVAGVLLTGLLDDGAAGLWEIQQQGGATVVQDPEEATFRSMPESAIQDLNVQYIVPVAEMGPLLTRLTMGDGEFTPESMQREHIEPAGQTCPECGGAMTLARLGELREYRCHTGHRMGLRTMIAEKGRLVELAINAALAQSEELGTLLETARAEAAPEISHALVEEIDGRKKEQAALRILNGKPKLQPEES